MLGVCSFLFRVMLLHPHGTETERVKTDGGRENVGNRTHRQGNANPNVNVDGKYSCGNCWHDKMMSWKELSCARLHPVKEEQLVVPRTKSVSCRVFSSATFSRESMDQREFISAAFCPRLPDDPISFLHLSVARTQKLAVQPLPAENLCHFSLL